MLSVEIAKDWLCSKTVDLDFTAPTCGTKLQASMEGLRRTQRRFRVVFDDMGAGRVAGDLDAHRAAGKIGDLDLDPGRLRPMVGEARAWSEQFFRNSSVAVHDRHAVRSEAGVSVARTESRMRRPLYSDQMAIGVLHAPRKHAVRVPEEMAVVGFDGIALGGFVSPELTTVAYSGADIGRPAVEAVISRLEGEVELPPHEQVLPVRLLVGESCGCVRTFTAGEGA
ncbi:substrate-binding domain-containing protein [Bosea thiooxidans]|nr:LacI family DNA-binding transcriptional regulator [Bosea sp. (in: a-proteobacteria)]